MYDLLISARQLCDRLEDNNLLVFDCRFDLAEPQKGEQAYHQAHIPGAFYAHLDRNLSSPITADSGRHPMPDSQLLIGWLASCGLQADSQVVVYDDTGGAMAARLWWLLKCLGHEAVALLDGGWPAWLEGGYAVNAELPEAQTSTFHARLDPHCVVSTEQILRHLNTPSCVIVDVRAAARFRGEQEPIDPVAGHIPGAWNIPLTENLDEHGHFKSKQELALVYEKLMQQHPPAQQVYMCGSGVTACHSVLAMEILSGQRPRVYAGSWSEWIRDDRRPIAREQ